jgi:hypothetical protein
MIDVKGGEQRAVVNGIFNVVFIRLRLIDVTMNQLKKRL